MIKDDEYVVAFCNPRVAREIPLPDEVVVVTGLLPDDEIIVVPKAEFLDWLYERGRRQK